MYASIQKHHLVSLESTIIAYAKQLIDATSKAKAQCTLAKQHQQTEKTGEIEAVFETCLPLALENTHQGVCGRCARHREQFEALICSI